jgi:hypothetical protein
VFDGAGRKLSGVEIEVGDPHDHAHALGGQTPRADIGVVVQRRDDDLISRLPGARERIGEMEGERRHVGTQDDPVGRPTNKIRQRDACLGDHLGARATPLEGTSDVGHRPTHALLHGGDHSLGNLGARGAIQVDVSRCQAGKLVADFRDGHQALGGVLDHA